MHIRGANFAKCDEMSGLLVYVVPWDMGFIRHGDRRDVWAAVVNELSREDPTGVYRFVSSKTANGLTSADTIILMSTEGIELLKSLGRRVAIDATFGLQRESDVEVTTLLVAEGEGEGSPGAFIILLDRSALSLYRALKLIRDELRYLGVEVDPERCLADDAKGEHKAVRALWPHCQVSVCLWHVLQV